MQTAAEYWVDWVCHTGNKDRGGVVTHAVPDGPDARAVCGVCTGGDGAVVTVAEAGSVGCNRCTKILQSRGVLPRIEN